MRLIRSLSSAAALLGACAALSVGFARPVSARDWRWALSSARYKKLKGLLKINDGKRNFDVLRAQQKFDAYTPVPAGR